MVYDYYENALAVVVRQQVFEETGCKLDGLANRASRVSQRYGITALKGTANRSEGP